MVGRKYPNPLSRRKIPQEKKILFSPPFTFLPQSYQPPEVILAASKLDSCFPRNKALGLPLSPIPVSQTPSSLEITDWDVYVTYTRESQYSLCSPT